MGFVLYLLLEVMSTIILGVYGMVAWNITIPVIFPSSPQISLLQAIAISFVIKIMTYDGNIPKDETDIGVAYGTVMVHIIMMLIKNTMILAILCLIMNVIY